MSLPIAQRLRGPGGERHTMMRNRANSGRLSGMHEARAQQVREVDEREPERVTEDLAGDTTRPRGAENTTTKPREIGGPKGAEPTRFGDWERAGR
ncbi:MAG: DUF1674 domain-containing protein [Gammaproteobacteria bacterium]